MRHGERVPANVAMSEEGAYVGDEGQVARLTKTPTEDTGNEDAGDGEESLRSAEPFLREQRLLALGAASLFNSREHACDEHENRRPRRERVVLLVGGDAEEEQREGREHGEQPGGSHAELEAFNVGGYVFPRGVLDVEIDRMTGIAVQVLHPVATCAPGHDEQRREKQAPREKPDEMRQPVPGEGHLVVVVREALAEEAQHVFVDEVEVPEAVDVAGGGLIADGVALVRIREAGEDVPRRSDGEIEQDSCDRLHLAPAAPLAAQQQQRNCGACEENGCNESLGQSCES